MTAQKLQNEVQNLLAIWRRGDPDGARQALQAVYEALKSWPVLVPFRYADASRHTGQQLHLSPGGACLLEALAHSGEAGYTLVDAGGMPVPDPQSWPLPGQLIPGADGYVFSLSAADGRIMLPLSARGQDGACFYIAFTDMNVLKRCIHLEDPCTHAALVSFEELCGLSRRAGYPGIVLDPDTNGHCFVPLPG